MAFNIVLNSSKAPFDVSFESNHLDMESEAIKKILQSLNHRDLGDFISENPDDARAMLAELGGGDDDDASAEEESDGDFEVPEEQWFTADEGLAVIRAMADHLQKNPKSVKNVNGVLRDLKGLYDVLSKVKAAGLRWHFVVAMDF